MSTAIKVENLSKAYQIGQIGTGTISRDLERWFVTKVLGWEDPFLNFSRVNDRATKGDTDVVWSLKDVNLEIKQGDAIGIIGRNGAGKSTLLKLLSRVTSPTAGVIKVKGRVASLLEVGTGFHSELTGRENIYLNGSILGMRRREIDRKLEEIVDFSGIERYIDTPVKRYSSGMFIRLAFAVAAHLESEILIVDEVLAVGDFEFQKKCIGKMDEVCSNDGRTILFVSHNMGAVQEFCDRGVQIEKGKIAFDGEISQCIEKYFLLPSPIDPKRDTEGRPILLGPVLINGSQKPVIDSGEATQVTLDFISRDIDNPTIFLIIENSIGQMVVHESITGSEIGFDSLCGKYTLRVELPTLWFSPGVYSVYTKFIAGAHRQRILSDRSMLRVIGHRDGTGKTLLTPKVNWKIEDADHAFLHSEFSGKAVGTVN